MKVVVYLAAILFGATATPNGYYHQQYNYKTSSSSYKNNELQHKTDDQGFYSKDGDLEGRTKPKVSSNSEHSEYVNPQLRERLNAGYLDAGTDLTSHGNLLANSYGASIGGGVSSGYQSGSQYGSGLYEGMASSDHIGGASNVYGTYGSGSSQSSYGSSSLSTVASRLQNDLQHEIQEALRSQSSYSHQADISELEAELRRNLTTRLNEILQEKYGMQTIRGGQSYSLTGGRPQTRPNYEQQELENLQRQVENTLLQQLRTSYSTSHQSYNQNYHYESTTTYRPTTYRPIYPNLNVLTTPRPFPEYPGGSEDTYYSQNGYNNRISSNVRYTPVPNPLSITNIASHVQNELDSQLNRLLEQTQHQYFSEDSRYSVYNLDSILERLRQELKSNLTYALNEELRSQYGTQVQRNNYMYSVGSNGQTSNQYNYNVADLENLRRQVENNLLTKLNRDFESARQRWISKQQTQQNSYGHSQSSDYRYGSSSNVQRYNENEYYRPTAASIIPLINTGVKGNQYHSSSGSYQSSNIAELQRQLQEDFSRQVQAAISQNQASINRYSTGTYGGTFEEAYQRLYNELQRNLTQQLQEYEASNVNQAQLDNLKSQLQRNLNTQLQRGLQQSYSASASYSASSGSSASVGAGAYSSSNSGYRAARGSDNSQTGYQYMSGGSYYAMEGEDCQGDSNVYQSYRAKRSYGYRSRPLGLSTHSGTGYGSSAYGAYNTGYNGNFGGYGSSGYSGSGSSYGQQPLHSVGQEEDDSDTIQQVEPINNFIGQQEIDIGQQIDDSDDTQQVEVNHGFGTIELGGQNELHASGQEQTQLSQERYTPQIEESTGEKLQSGSQFSQSNYKPSSQYTGINSYGKLELGSQGGVDQQVDHSDLTQQEEYIGLSQQNLNYARKPDTGISGNWQHESQAGQEIDDSDLTQQVEDITFDNNSKPNRKPFNQDLNVGTTQVISSHLSNVGNIAPQIQSTTQKSSIRQFELQPIGQEIDDTDTTLQVNQLSDLGVLGTGVLVQTSTKKPRETVGSSFNYQSNPKYGNAPTNSQAILGQEIDHSDTLQENNFQASREINRNLDFTPQIEDTDFHNLGSNTNYKKKPLENVPSLSPFSTWNLSPEIKEIFEEVEKNLTKEIEFTIKSDISYAIAPNQLYLNILRKLQNNINNECQRLLKDRSYYLNIDQNNVNKLENYLKITLEKKLQEELLNSGFSQENFEISNFGHGPQPNVNYQNPHFDTSLYYEGGQRYNQYSTRYSPKPFSYDFIQREINSQSSINANNDRVLINQHTTPLPTLNEIIENNRQLPGSSGQITIPYTSTPQTINFNRRPTGTNVNYPSNAVDIGKQNLEEDSNLSRNTPKPFERPNPDSENVTPKIKPIIGISEIDQKPLQPNNNEFVDIRAPESLPTLSTDNQVLIDKTNMFSRPTENRPDNSPTPKTNIVNPLDLSNFPPLPPPQNSGSVISAVEPQGEIPQQPSLFQTSTQWQRNINERQRHEQRLSDAEREADLLIEKLRAAQQNRPTQHVNVGQQENANSYESHHDSRTYLHRTTVQNRPNQYEIIQVKLENITPKQFQIINQIDDDFTKIIEDAVKNQVNTASNFQHSLRKLETELRINLTEIMEGHFYPDFGTTDVNFNKYSDLITQEFQVKTIPDLRKYLEIKFIKKIREQLRKAYKIDNENGRYEFQHVTRTQTERTAYQSPGKYEVIQVKLENITPDQLKIIMQLENDFSQQIEAAIQNHLNVATTGYLSSYENYQILFNKLEEQLKYNITECVQGASEPGLSKYSEVITKNFDHNKIANLERYLEIKLTKNLRESLKTHFSVNVAESPSFDSKLNSYQSSHHYGVQYGHTHNFDLNTEKALDIKPIEFQHATVVVPPPPPYSGGVKGGKIYKPILETPAIQTSYNNQNSQYETEQVEVVTTPDDIGEPTTEKTGWWKRFGNKVKQSATNLKKKITGES